VVYNWPLASAAALTLLVSVGLGVAAIATLGRRSQAYASSASSAPS
jgi:ABC-type spermidine/putrescine transport system permease subunit I